MVRIITRIGPGIDERAAMIFQFSDALDRSTCRSLCEIYDRHAPHAEIFDYSGFPVLHWEDFRALPEASAMLRALLRHAQGQIADVLPDLAAVHPETVFLACLAPGGRHPRHADNCQEEPDGRWVPNHTPQRDVSALYYLNDDFDGGEIVFEQHGLIVRPRAGLLVIFPSDRHHVHEVFPVAGGKRYSVQTWFTRQASMALAGV